MNTRELRIKGYSEIKRTSQGHLTAKKRNQTWFSRDGGETWKRINKLEAKKMAEEEKTTETPEETTEKSEESSESKEEPEAEKAAEESEEKKE